MEAEREETWREITIDTTLTMALGHAAQAELVERWANARGMELGSLGAMLTPINQIQRLQEKILDKARQLPPDGPNLLVISAQDLFIDAGEITQIARQVMAILASCPKVSTVILGYEGTVVWRQTDARWCGLIVRCGI